MELKFIQMSDIHFQKSSNDSFDEDVDIREGAVLDISTEAKRVLGTIDGVLVCGDIAYSAQPNEYDHAKEFLKGIVDIFDKEMSDIYCVPGNHDVNQSDIRRSMYILDAQSILEETAYHDSSQIENELRRIMESPGSKDILLAPLENYQNEFAGELFCKHTADKLYWDSVFSLGDYKLLLQGMNSVYISSHLDHKDKDGNPRSEERKMVMNPRQIPSVKEKTIYLSMCHHPPECWIDQSMSERIDHRVMIQLYGHKHWQTIEEKDNRLRIYSGALQPERNGQDWKPQYNWIVLEICGDELQIKIYPRIYEEQSGKFVADTSICDEREIYKLCRLSLCNSNYDELRGKDDVQKQENPKEEEYIMDNVMRNIIYKMMRLNGARLHELNKMYSDSGLDFTNQDIDAVVKWLHDKGNEDEFWKTIRRL